MNIFAQSIEDEQATLDYIYQQEHPFDPDDPWPDISKLGEPSWDYPLNFNDGQTHCPS